LGTAIVAWAGQIVENRQRFPVRWNWRRLMGIAALNPSYAVAA
jgi:hypothetical protein